MRPDRKSLRLPMRKADDTARHSQMNHLWSSHGNVWLWKALKERNPQRPNEKGKETWGVKKVLDHLKEIDSEKAEL